MNAWTKINIGSAMGIVLATASIPFVITDSLPPSPSVSPSPDMHNVSPVSTPVAISPSPDMTNVSPVSVPSPLPSPDMTIPVPVNTTVPLSPVDDESHTLTYLDTLPACPNDEVILPPNVNMCYWDASLGNGTGRSFIVTR